MCEMCEIIFALRLLLPVICTYSNVTSTVIIFKLKTFLLFNAKKAGSKTTMNNMFKVKEVT